MNKRQPVVSVLMTSYNREKYIAEAIESVLASSYSDFEFIIVDDASTDRTVSIAKSFERTDSRIRVYVNEVNIGQFANRNKAALYAKGAYLKYVDSDDLIYPYTLQVMVDTMLEFPGAGLGFCYTIRQSNKSFPYLLKPADTYQQHYFEGGLLYTGPIGLIIKKEAFENVQYFEEYGMPSDNHLSLKIAAKFPVVAMPPDLFFWRLHGNQAFSESSSLKNIFDNYKFNRDILNHKSCPFPSGKRQKALKNISRVFAMNLLKIVLKKPYAINDLFSLSRSNRINFKEVFKKAAMINF